MEEPNLVKTLREKGRLKPEDEVWVKTLPRKKSLYADDFQITQSDKLLAAVEKLNIKRAYAYQKEAITAIRSGKDVIISTPTASGKSLCYNIPVLETLRLEPKAKALYIFPMKALANDQLKLLNQLRILGNQAIKIEAWTYDGDTPEEHRKLIRMHPPQILITNPDMLHASFLAYHEQWSEVYRNIKFLVIDEIHEYRGFFGANAAYIIRRFLHKCNQYGSMPKIILCSATVANPEEHAFKLTNRRCQVIRSNEIGNPLKHFIFLNPYITGFPHEEYLGRRFVETAVSIAETGKSVLCFCPTRKSAERLSKYAKQEAKKQSLELSLISPYRSGYNPDDRRKIEDGLKEGTIRLVFSTSALELGVDIGKLDVCFMLGFPETVMSFWQRAGRVGRSIDKEAYVFVWANRTPVDQFYVKNPQLFFDKPLDNLVVDLANEEIVKNHYECIISENNGDKKLNFEILGEELKKSINNSEEFTDVDSSLVSRFKPHRRLAIRNISQGTYRLVTKGSATEIGEISGDKIFSETYMGAVYDHIGRSYRVVAHGEDEIILEPCSDETFTKPSRYIHIHVDEPTKGRRWEIKGGHIELMFGRLSIRDALSGYVEYNSQTKDAIKREKYDQETSKTYRTKGLWLSVISDDSIIPNVFLPTISAETLHVMEHGIRQAVPLSIPSDPFDISGDTYPNHQQAKLSMFIFDAIWGGIGIAEKSFELFPDLIKQSLQITEACTCKHGCPGCVMISRCNNNNDGLDKQNSIALHKTFLELTLQMPNYILKGSSWIKT